MSRTEFGGPDGGWWMADMKTIWVDHYENGVMGGTLLAVWPAKRQQNDMK